NHVLFSFSQVAPQRQIGRQSAWHRCRNSAAARPLRWRGSGERKNNMIKGKASYMGDRRRTANGQHTAGHETRMQQRNRKMKGGKARQVPSLCVYCRSRPGINPAHAEAARTLGRAMAVNGIGLVYGGGGLGLMGEIARTVLANGGRVTGIIPEFLAEKERMLLEATEINVVKHMHDRKRLMFDRADAFVALPGGIGTL